MDAKTMTTRHPPAVRMVAWLSGRVRATTVEADLHAGMAAYDDLSAAEDLRRDLAWSGADLWSLEAGPSSQLLATWCAFALQTLGEQLVASEYAARPRLFGYLPAMTAQQATVFFDAGRSWSARARRAAADPGYDIAAELDLPAGLPTWRRMEPCPATHVEAMLAAGRALRDRGQVALADFSATTVPAGKEGVAECLGGLFAQADAGVDQAEHMWRPSSDQALHRVVESTLRGALDQLFRLGQLLARPSLLEAAGPNRPGRAASRLPGESGFDPWCLSDPAAVRSLRGDSAARLALEHLWRSDPDPAATLALFEEVVQKAADGAIAPSDAEGSYYYCTPWPTIYVVRRPVAIAGRDLLPGERFTLEVCVGGADAGGGNGFRRELLVRSFRPTSELGFCDQMDRRPGGGSC